MADSATLKLLLQRVEAAEGADRELDHAVWKACAYSRETSLSVAVSDPAMPTFVLQDAEGRVIHKTVSGAWRWEPTDHPYKEGAWVFDAEDGRHYHYGYVSKVTASLDAALALVERVLPGFHILVSSCGAPPGARDPGSGWRSSLKGNYDFTTGQPTISLSTVVRPTPALALLAALLKALSSEARPLGSAREAPEDGQPKPNPESEPLVERMPMGEAGPK